MDPAPDPSRCSVTTVRGNLGQAEVHKRAATATDAERLGREAAALRRARHPGVVDLVAFGPEDDGEGAVLVTRLAGTHTLATWNAPSLDEVAGTLVALAETLADLHHLGIVHGDVVAEHVILDAAGRPVLCGFERRREHRPTDDVAALGHLVHHLLAEGTGPDDGGRTARREPRRRGAERRRLLDLADQARDADERTRPGARRFAAAVVAAVPGASITTNPGATLRTADPDRTGAATHGDGGPDRSPDAADRSPDPPGAPGTPDADTTERGPEPSGSARRGPRIASTAAAVVGLACLVFGALTAWSTDRPYLAAPSDAAPAPAPADPAPAEPAATDPTGTDWPTAAPSGADPRDTARPDRPAAGAPEPIVPGGIVEHGGERFALGEPGDQLVLADPRCATAPAVSLLRTDGTTYFFDRWAEPGHDVPARPGPTVPAGSRWVPAPLDASGCAALSVRTLGGDTIAIAADESDPPAPDPGGPP